MEVRRLYSSPLLAIREVHCSASRGDASGVETSPAPSLAIPLRGCFTVSRRDHAVVGDPNTAMLFDAGLPYRVEHPADHGDVCLVLDCEAGTAADAFGNGARKLAELRPFRATYAPLTPALHFRAQALRSALRRGNADPLFVEEEGLALVARLGAAPAPTVSRVAQGTVERAKAFVGGHFTEGITLGAIAAAVGTSPFSLARAFPAVTGMTTHRYVVALRLAAALDAVAGGERSLSRVAVDAGFAHHSHMTKLFAQTFGATPQTVRRRFALDMTAST